MKDAVGNRLTMTASGVTTTYTYAAADQLTQRQTGAQTWAYTYDGNGNWTKVVGPDGTTEYTYDDANRLLSITTPDGNTTTYIYDAKGQLARETYKGVTHRLQWERGRLIGRPRLRGAAVLSRPLVRPGDRSLPNPRP